MARVGTWLLPLVLASSLDAHAAIDLALVASGIPYLVGIEDAGDGSGRLFLVSQSGEIRIYDGASVLATPFLDLSGSVGFGGEGGLLGLAFHPDYASNGSFYVNYTDTAGDTVVARYQVSGNPNVASPGSATILLTQNQPFSNHNGGQIRFGPDGFLYIALGDGGSGGDPQDNGQDLRTWLGKMLRIDVDTGSPYAVPAGNPFVATVGALDEIWSYGLRNPWRFSFDRDTGDMFIADVGQGDWEEISFEPANTGGRNYGWRLMEGTHCFNPSTNCDTGSLVHPVLEYPHSLGCSVTGGFRYRGTALADHVGTYFFGDFCTGRIWGATPNDDGSWTASQLLDTSISIATFGEDAAGNIYVGHYAGSGQLYRLVPAAASMSRLTVTKLGNGDGLVTSSPAGVHCGTMCAVEANGTTITLSVSADSGSTFAGWSGDADCSDGVVTLSASRQCYARFTAPFTDATLSSGVTPVKAVHVAELRSRIDSVRAGLGLASVSWTTPVLSAGATVVQAAHILQMRTALDEAYDAAKQPRPGYTDAALGSGTTIRAAHVTELRSAIVALE